MAGRMGAVVLGISRSWIGARIAASIARWVPQLFPGKIAILPELVVIRHPAPIASVHLLAVARRGIRDAIVDHAGADTFWESLGTWLRRHGPEWTIAAGITNLGARQEVRLLHVHLMAAAPGWAQGPPDVTADSLVRVMAELRTDRSLAAKTASIALRPGIPAGWQASIESSG